MFIIDMLNTTRWYEKRFIAEQARRIRARRIVEVGVFTGKTTAILSRVAGEHDGYVVAIDPMTWSNTPENFIEWVNTKLTSSRSYEEAFWKNARASGHDNVTLHKALSTDATLRANADAKLAEFDLAFIDANHTYEAARADVQIWGARVRKGGVILLHDAKPSFPGVLRVLRELRDDARYRVTMPKGMNTVAMVEVVAHESAPKQQFSAAS
jgi:predicted O-methyltransferase YrrM